MNTQKLNILVVNSAREWIGEAARCLYLTQMLNANGHNALLVVRNGFPLHDHARVSGVPVETLHMTGKFTGVLDLADVIKLAALISRRRIDVVHTHRGKDHWLGAAAVRLFPRSKRPRLIRTRHVVMPVRQHAFNRWVYQKATDTIIAVSEASRASFGPLLQGMKPPHIIYAGIDGNEFSPEKRDNGLRASLGVKESELLVGLIGRFQNIKGQDVFINAAKQTLQRHPHARFLLCGREAVYTKERYEQLARSLNISDRVTVLTYQDEIAPLIASLDIGVIASLGSEGSSRIAFEYMASGVPMVATRVGCLPEILNDGENGLLVAPGDAGELATAIKQLIDFPDLRAKFRDSNRILAVERYSLDRFLRQTLDAYTEKM